MLEALSRVQRGLFYVDDLVLVVKTKELPEKKKKWKLRVFDLKRRLK